MNHIKGIVTFLSIVLAFLGISGSLIIEKFWKAKKRVDSYMEKFKKSEEKLEEFNSEYKDLKDKCDDLFKKIEIINANVEVYNKLLPYMEIERFRIGIFSKEDEKKRESIKKLIQFLKDKEPAVQIRSIGVLGKMEEYDEEVRKELEVIVNNDKYDNAVVVTARNSLLKLKNLRKDPVLMLIKFSRNENFVVREEIIKELGSIRKYDDRIINRLNEIIKDGSEKDKVVKKAKDVLYKLEHLKEDSISKLIELARYSTNPIVKKRSIELLGMEEYEERIGDCLREIVRLYLLSSSCGKAAQEALESLEAKKNNSP